MPGTTSVDDVPRTLELPPALAATNIAGAIHCTSCFQRGELCVASSSSASNPKTRSKSKKSQSAVDDQVAIFRAVHEPTSKDLSPDTPLPYSGQTFSPDFVKLFRPLALSNPSFGGGEKICPARSKPHVNVHDYQKPSTRTRHQPLTVAPMQLGNPTRLLDPETKVKDGSYAKYKRGFWDDADAAIGAETKLEVNSGAWGGAETEGRTERDAEDWEKIIDEALGKILDNAKHAEMALKTSSAPEGSPRVFGDSSIVRRSKDIEKKKWKGKG